MKEKTVLLYSQLNEMGFSPKIFAVQVTGSGPFRERVMQGWSVEDIHKLNYDTFLVGSSNNVDECLDFLDSAVRNYKTSFDDTFTVETKTRAKDSLRSLYSNLQEMNALAYLGDYAGASANKGIIVGSWPEKTEKDIGKLCDLVIGSGRSKSLDEAELNARFMKIVTKEEGDSAAFKMYSDILKDLKTSSGYQ